MGAESSAPRHALTPGSSFCPAPASAPPEGAGIPALALGFCEGRPPRGLTTNGSEIGRAGLRGWMACALSQRRKLEKGIPFCKAVTLLPQLLPCSDPFLEEAWRVGRNIWTEAVALPEM